MQRLPWLLGIWFALLAQASAQGGDTTVRAAPKLDVPRGKLLPGSVKLETLSDSRLRELAPQPRPERQPSPSAAAAAPEAARSKVAALGLVNAQGAARSEQTLRVIAGNAKVSTAEGGDSVVEVPKRGVAVVSSSSAKTAANESQLKTSEKTPLPWVVLDDDPDAPEESAVRATRPFLQLAEAIRWDAARRLHVAEFWFGLDVESGSPGPLASPIYVLFAVTCGELVPDDKVTIGASGIAGYARVKVGCSPSEKNALARQKLSLHLDQARLDYPFEIPRLSGVPTLISSAASAEGLGLSTLELTVENREEDGTLLPVPADLTVALATEAGEIDVKQLVIPKGAASATAHVRPHGMGALRVAALVAGVSSRYVQVDLGFPTLAVGAALVGGAIGGALAARKKRRTKPRPFLARTLEGTLVALIATAVSLLLADFSAIGKLLPSSEIAMFALSAIAGFVGTHLVELAAPLLFPALRAARGAAPEESADTPTAREPELKP